MWNLRADYRRSRSVKLSAVPGWPAALRARCGEPLAGEHLRVFALDCSASMLAHGAFAQAMGLLLHWAYLQRTPVALLCFGPGQVQ